MKDHVVADDMHGLRRLSPNPLRVCWLAGLALVFGQIVFNGSLSAQERPAKTESGLPPGYKPPPDPPDVMLIEKPLLDDEERKMIGKTLNKKYMTPLRNGEFRNEKTRADIRNGIRYRLNEIAISSQRTAEPSVRKKLSYFRGRLTASGGDVSQAAKLVTKPGDALDVRKKFLDMVIEETAQLFDNNYYARIQAALILGELNVLEDDPVRDTKAEPYAPAAKLLCKVMLDPEQPEGVKIVCVLGLIRILHQGNPNVEQKREIGQAIVSELKRTDTFPAYQARLAEALGYNDVPLDLDREPFIFNALMAVVEDKDGKRELRTRVQAAWSLGRIPLDRTMDLSKLTVEVAALGYDLATSQAEKPKLAVWKRCAWVLYLAFEKKDDNDLNAKRDPNLKGGLLNNPVTRVDAQEAFNQIQPIVREILVEKTAAPEQVQGLAKWLQAKGFRPRQVQPAAADDKSIE